MGTVVQLQGWKMRVYRLAARSNFMSEATAFCRRHGVIPYPELMVRLNPEIKSIK